MIVRGASKKAASNTNKPLAAPPPASRDALLELCPPALASSAVRTRWPRSLSELVTTQLVPGNMAKSPALLTNYGVDYVVVYRYDLNGELRQSATLSLGMQN